MAWMKTAVCCFLLVIAMEGCSPAYQGIRVRGESPPINDAFRLLSLAVSADSFAVASVDPKAHALETSWRPLREKEKGTAGSGAAGGAPECRLSIQLDERGRLYDVFVTPWIRAAGPGSPESVADVNHPLRKKWTEAIRSIIRTESREED